jgi:hypothetical protein
VVVRCALSVVCVCVCARQSVSHGRRSIDWERGRACGGGGGGAGRRHGAGGWRHTHTHTHRARPRVCHIDLILHKIYLRALSPRERSSPSRTSSSMPRQPAQSMLLATNLCAKFIIFSSRPSPSLPVSAAPFLPRLIRDRILRAELQLRRCAHTRRLPSGAIQSMLLPINAPLSPLPLRRPPLPAPRGLCFLPPSSCRGPGSRLIIHSLDGGRAGEDQMDPINPPLQSILLSPTNPPKLPRPLASVSCRRRRAVAPRPSARSRLIAHSIGRSANQSSSLQSILLSFPSLRRRRSSARPDCRDVRLAGGSVHAPHRSPALCAAPLRAFDLAQSMLLCPPINAPIARSSRIAEGPHLVPISVAII